MEDVLAVIGIIAVAIVWLSLHYTTKWKQAPKITPEDENLLDEMFNLARRLEDRLATVERIAAADHPDWKPGLPAPTANPQVDWRPGTADPTRSYSVDRRN